MPGPPRSFLFQPGDILLFNRTSPFNWIIRVKTWSRYTHVEVHDGQGTTFAARNGQGCGEYLQDLEGLALVLRPPVGAFDRIAARKWFYGQHIYRQGYDWVGLLNFMYARAAGRRNGKMFCSEFATRYLRSGGFGVFPRTDADTVAPCDFNLIRDLFVEWASDDEIQRAWERAPLPSFKGE